MEASFRKLDELKLSRKQWNTGIAHILPANMYIICISTFRGYLCQRLSNSEGLSDSINCKLIASGEVVHSSLFHILFLTQFSFMSIMYPIRESTLLPFPF